MPQDQFVVAEIMPRGVGFSGMPVIDSANPISGRPWKRRRLLWVDDSQVLLSLYKAVFESLGFEVLAIASPQEALCRLSSDAADVAILDYDMPEMDGGELASFIKNRFPMLPVILYTGSAGIPEDVLCCVDAVCAKAAPREELVAMIERLTRELYEPSQSGHLASFPPSAAAQQA